VEEIIHSFTPDQGFITTITPRLITYDRDPEQIEDAAMISRIYETAESYRRTKTGLAITGGALTIAGAATLAFAPSNVLKGVGSIVGLAGIGLMYNGIMGATKGYHRFLHDSMMEIMGGDVINFTTLIHKGFPMICGFDGVDYTSLKTLINHKAANVKGLINRYSSFKDPYGSVVYNAYDPGNANGLLNYGLAGAPFLRNILGIKTTGSANPSIGFWTTAFGAPDFGDYKIGGK
jgi:hypothetical protein